MAAHNERARRAGGQRARARNAFESSAASNGPEIPQPTASLQSEFVARRYGVSLHVAALIAQLHFGEAHL
jgi:hypothetical protein